MSLSQIQVTGNTFAATVKEIKATAAKTLGEAGEMFRAKAYAECPVSVIATPGYVHLRDTIGFEVDDDSLISQMWVTFYVIKDYAAFINDGTSRMPARPFFTDGVLLVQYHFEDIVETRFHEIMSGRLTLPLQAVS